MEKSLLTFSIALILLLTLTTARQAQGQTDTGVIAGKVLPPPPPPSVPPVAKQAGPAIAPLPPRPAIVGSRVQEPATPGPAPVAAPVPAPVVAAAPALPRVSVDILAPPPPPKPELATVTAIASPAVPPVPPVVLVDTIQPRENQFPHLSCSISDDGTTKTESIDATDRDGKKYKLNKLNDVITFLSVDGVEVPKEKYGEYEQLVRQLEQQRSDNRRRGEQQHIKNLKIKTEAFQLRQEHDIEAKKWVMAKEMKDRRVVVFDKQIKDIQLQNELTKVYLQKIDGDRVIVQTKKGYAVKNLCVVPCPEVKVIGRPAYKADVVVVGKKVRLVEDGVRIQEQKDLARALINELVKDHIINDAGSIVWFGITNDQFIVNGAKQPAETLEKYKAKYLSHPGMGLFYGPVKMSGTGYFIDKDDL